ncbi:hypothetical protein GWI33_022386 [Rhynchophorus ferrugineus]|uniref:Uncharacterized protein n=1 Tax=Rhynchophorus ferrugineus TaxID=354439 RepID=A0A834ML74_RHYFE|nr:hypothetical protein GWI33_022386 [Rhynchophorus ferrugineus]
MWSVFCSNFVPITIRDTPKESFSATPLTDQMNRAHFRTFRSKGITIFTDILSNDSNLTNRFISNNQLGLNEDD